MYRKLVNDSDKVVARNAAFALGELYYYGAEDGSVQMDMDLAVEHIMNSAALGSPHAQFLLSTWYASGLESYVARDEATAVLYQYFAAIGGDDGATMAMGYRHLMGDGVPRNCISAMRYYKLAAQRAVQMMGPVEFSIRPESLDLEHVPSNKPDGFTRIKYLATMNDAFKMGGEVCYRAAQMITIAQRDTLRGKQVDSEVLEDVRQLLHRVLDAGYARAGAFLGYLHTYGYGVPVNTTLGFRYYANASETAEARMGIGLVYYHGLGVRQDHDRALHYFGLAAKSGFPEAVYYLGLLLERIYPMDALHHFQSAGNAGHLRAMYKEANAMEQGKFGMSPSCSAAVYKYKRVAENGLWGVDFMQRAKHHYDLGEYETAFKLYHTLAQEGRSLAQQSAGKLYDMGFQKTNDTVQMSYYEQAANQGNINAILTLGNAYYYGHKGMDQDYFKSLEKYQSASTASPEAVYNIGYMHEIGVGFPQNFKLAIKHYDRVLTMDRHAKYPIFIAKQRVAWKQWAAFMIEQYRDKSWSEILQWTWQSVLNHTQTMYKRILNTQAINSTASSPAVVETIVKIQPTPQTDRKQNLPEAQRKQVENHKVQSLPQGKPTDSKSNDIDSKSKPIDSKRNPMNSKNSHGDTMSIPVVRFQHHEHIEIETQVAIENEFTVEGWFYLHIGTANPSMLIHHRSDFNLILVQVNQKFRIVATGFPEMDHLRTKANIEPNAWYHIGLVKHEAYVAIYVNGKMAAVRKYRHILPRTVSPYIVGARNGDSMFFTGKAAMVRIYAMAATPMDMRDSMFSISAPLDRSKDVVLDMNITHTNFYPRPTLGTMVEMLLDKSSHDHPILLYGHAAVDPTPWPFEQL